MNKQSPLLTVTLLLISLIVIATLSYFGIQFFSFEPTGIQTSNTEISLGATSKLGWILTTGFVLLLIVFLLLRRIIDRLRGRF